MMLLSSRDVIVLIAGYSVAWNGGGVVVLLTTPLLLLMLLTRPSGLTTRVSARVTTLLILDPPTLLIDRLTTAHLPVHVTTAMTTCLCSRTVSS